MTYWCLSWPSEANGPEEFQDGVSSTDPDPAAENFIADKDDGVGPADHGSASNSGAQVGIDVSRKHFSPENTSENCTGDKDDGFGAPDSSVSSSGGGLGIDLLAGVDGGLGHPNRSSASDLCGRAGHGTGWGTARGASVGMMSSITSSISMDDEVAIEAALESLAELLAELGPLTQELHRLMSPDQPIDQSMRPRVAQMWHWSDMIVKRHIKAIECSPELRDVFEQVGEACDHAELSLQRAEISSWLVGSVPSFGPEFLEGMASWFLPIVTLQEDIQMDSVNERLSREKLLRLRRSYERLMEKRLRALSHSHHNKLNT